MPLLANIFLREPAHQFILGVGSIRSKSRVGSAVGQGDHILRAADKNEHLERALYLYGSLPRDWRGLHMVLEAAEDAHGGESGLIGKGWVSDKHIQAFKAAANSYKAIRLEARHGSIKSGVERAALTLDEAREMVRTVIEKWTKQTV